MAGIEPRLLLCRELLMLSFHVLSQKQMSTTMYLYSLMGSTLYNTAFTLIIPQYGCTL